MPSHSGGRHRSEWKDRASHDHDADRCGMIGYVGSCSRQEEDQALPHRRGLRTLDGRESGLPDGSVAEDLQNGFRVPTVIPAEALDVALSWGWIDGTDERPTRSELSAFGIRGTKPSGATQKTLCQELRRAPAKNALGIFANRAYDIGSRANRVYECGRLTHCDSGAFEVTLLERSGVRGRDFIDVAS